MWVGFLLNIRSPHQAVVCVGHLLGVDSEALLTHLDIWDIPCMLYCHPDHHLWFWALWREQTGGYWGPGVGTGWGGCR